MLALLENAWEEFGETACQFAQNVGIVPDNPSDRLLMLFLSEKCGQITPDSETSAGLSKMMTALLTTGNLSGSIQSALDDPEFLRSCF